MKKGKAFIGTSGWSYKHWKGRFYPEGLRDDEQLAYYLKHFSTVEINNSFYRLPAPETFSAWKKATPTDFLFAVKGSRFFTHMKKLNLDKPLVSPFFKSAGRLREKLGPILFQLPPRWKFNGERLDHFLSIIPRKLRYTVEFRDQTWYRSETFDILRKHNAAFCIYELEHHLSPLEITADFVYVRLHGPGNKYQGSYQDEALKEWSNRIREWQKKGKDVYVYFDNDQEGYAAFNALTLIKFLKVKKARKKG